MARLEVEIVGDASGLTRSVDRANSSLKRMEKTAGEVETSLTKTANAIQSRLSKEIRGLTGLEKTLGNGFDTSAGKIRAYERAIKELSQVGFTPASQRVKQLTSELNNLKSPINQTSQPLRGVTSTMLSFNQAVQDAPFGIRGVANNIQQLTAQFGFLSQQAGGTRKALGAMVASLSGPAGILLAVSLVTSALTTFANSGKGFGDILRSLAGEGNKLSDAMRSLANASAEAQGQAKAEEAVLKSLLSIAQDETRSRQARQQAIDRINKDYPELNANITLETSNTRKVTDAVNKYVTSLLQAARAKAAQELISKSYTKLLELEAKAAIESTNGWNFFVQSVLTGGNIINGITNLTQKGLQKQTEETKKLNAEIERYTKLLNDVQGGAADQGTLFTPDDKKVKKAAQKARKEIDGITADLTGSLTRSAQIMTNGLEDALKAFDNRLEKSAARFATAFPKDFIRFLQNPEGFIPSENLPGRIQPNLRGPVGGTQRVIPELDPTFGTEFTKLLEKNLNRVAQRFGREMTDTFRTLQTEGDFTFRSILRTFASGLNNALGDAVASIAGSVGATVGESVGKSVSKGIGGTIGDILGPGIGTVVGGLITGIGSLIGGLFGRGKRRREAEKQAEIQRQQLEEQKKMAKELERQSALAYTSSIIGKMLPGFGTVSNIDINQQGQLTARIDGKDLLFVLNRAEKANNRGH